MDRVVSFLSRLVFTHRMAGSGNGDEGEVGDEGGGADPSTCDFSPTLINYYLVNSWLGECFVKYILTFYSHQSRSRRLTLTRNWWRLEKKNSLTTSFGGELPQSKSVRSLSTSTHPHLEKGRTAQDIQDKADRGRQETKKEKVD